MVERAVSQPAQTPASVTRLLRRCLEQDLRRRLRDVGDARLELEDVSGSASRIEPAPPTPPRMSRRAAMSALAGAAAGAAAASTFMIGRGGDGLPRDVMRFPIPLEDGGAILLRPYSERCGGNVLRIARTGLYRRLRPAYGASQVGLGRSSL